jgi:hypothetical protein
VSQNRSHAVMSQRAEPHDSLDFFPTPPWATRALCEHVLAPLVSPRFSLPLLSVWEPACGDGAMARPLGEYFGRVTASDVHTYGFGEIRDFLMPQVEEQAAHWIITNPPFRLGEQFVRRALTLANQGVAMLVRTAFLESQDRFRLYSEHPPAIVAQFVERVPMVKGRLQRDASTATAYCWIVWRKGETDTRFKWIPPCKKQLDRDADWPVAA